MRTRYTERMKTPKTLDERVKEVVGIRMKMNELGLTVSTSDGLARLVDILNDFVRGHGYTGTVEIPEIHKRAIVKLSLRTGIESHVTLRHVR